MPAPANARLRALPARKLLTLAAVALAASSPWAQRPGAATAPGAAAASQENAQSALDAPLFYQLLIGEIALSAGEAGNAYSVLLDAARRTRDEALFKRSVDVALQARAGDQALAAARAWRQAIPQSLEALRHELQLLAALNRSAEVVEPLKLLLMRTPESERVSTMASLPRLFLRSGDKRQAAGLLEDLLQPYTAAPHPVAVRSAARVASGRAWLQAADNARAMLQAERALADHPAAVGAALLALELMPSAPAAERLVTDYLQRPGADIGVQLSYARAPWARRSATSTRSRNCRRSRATGRACQRPGSRWARCSLNCGSCAMPRTRCSAFSPFTRPQRRARSPQRVTTTTSPPAATTAV